jgi:hypothetical protein
MVVFLADRDNIRIRQLHRRIKNRFQSDDRFDVARLRVAQPREPGPYRAVGQVDAQRFLDDSSYPIHTARIEVGFQLPSHRSHERYWFNWIESDRTVLVGWHQDDTHPDLGPVHLQVNQGATTIDREPAAFIDQHPMAVVEARLQQLPATVPRIEWVDGTTVGIE